MFIWRKSGYGDEHETREFHEKLCIENQDKVVDKNHTLEKHQKVPLTVSFHLKDTLLRYIDTLIH